MIYDCPKCNELNKDQLFEDKEVCPECLIALDIDLGPISLKYIDELDNEEW